MIFIVIKLAPYINIEKDYQEFSWNPFLNTKRLLMEPIPKQKSLLMELVPKDKKTSCGTCS